MTTLTRYTKQFVQYLRGTKAVSALEYALLVGAIAVGASAALLTMGDEIVDVIETATDSIEAVEGDIE